MLFKRVEAVKPGDLSCFIGKTLTTMDGSRVKVETIVGSKVYPTRFELNGEHWIVILAAYLQLNGVKITPEWQKSINQFDETTVDHIERAKEPEVGPVATKEVTLGETQ